MRGSPVMKLFFKMDKDISDDKLNRNIRAHGNLSEYAPIFFILLLVTELTGDASFNFMLFSAITFSYGRLAHGICFAFYDNNPVLRISGMLTTYIGIIMLAFGLIIF